MDGIISVMPPYGAGPKRTASPQISASRLAAMAEEATVDCSNESEQVTGWFTMIEENVVVPFDTMVLGVQVTVESLDLNQSGDQIVAICTRGDARQSLPVADLPLPSPPPKGADWIEAYRKWQARQ